MVPARLHGKDPRLGPFEFQAKLQRSEKIIFKSKDKDTFNII
jgi:hypothetical protein